MRDSNRGRTTAVWLPILLIALVACSGGAAAAGSDTVQIDNPADGATTDHTWNVTLPAGADGTLQHLVVNYTGTGANVSTPGASGYEVTANGSTVRFDPPSFESDTRLNLTLRAPITVSSGDRVTFTASDVQNPSARGTYTASIELNNSTGTFGSTSETFSIVNGGYVNGTVTNTSASTLSGADVIVENASTRNRVASVTTDSNGEYTTYVPSGTYEYSFKATGYATKTSSVSVTEGGQFTQDAVLNESSFINGTVTDGSESVVGITVMAFNATSGTYITQDTTDANGNYSLKVDVDKYEIEPRATAYAADEVNVTVSSPGSTHVQDFTLTKKGYLNGTVTDQQGTLLSGINLIADERGTKSGRSTTTAADGSFSFRVAPGQYDLVAYGNSDYEFNLKANLTVKSDTETRSGLTLTETPDSGTITGRVVTADGTPITNVRVSAGDTSYQYYNSTTTDGNGNFALEVPEGTYRVNTNPSGRPAERESGVAVTAGESTSVALVVPERAYITGRVTNSSGGVAGVGVLADSSDGQYFNVTNATGYYNITVAPGEYSTTVFATGQDAESKTIEATTGSVSTADFALVKTEVVSKSVKIQNGPGSESDLGVRAQVASGLLQIQLVNESQTPGSGVGAPQELEPMGVTDDTAFNITVTVTNFSADSLLWGLDDARYTTTENDTVANGTDITITGNPVTLQATQSSGAKVGPLLFESPNDVRWPTERDDRADIGFNRTVYVGVFDLANVPDEVRSQLRGVSVTTNAQRFSTPTVEDESLRIWIAGPSTTVDGEEHTGFYQATIPDALLNEWGVSDPETELQALYKGSSRDFTVTETAGGARIRLENINYSAGYVEVQANPDTGSNDGGSTDYDSSSDDDPTPSPTLTPAPTMTPSPTDVPTIGSTETPISDSVEDLSGDTSSGTDGDADSQVTAASDGTETESSMPGMGALVAILAVLGTGLLVGRRQ